MSISKPLLARRIDQVYSRLVWSKDPNEERLTDKKVIDINALNHVPNMMSFHFLNEGSLVKSYLLKREFEFPKLKRFYKPFVEPKGFLKFKCTTNLFDMTHLENSKCVLTVPINRIAQNNDERHVLKVLAGSKLFQDQEIKIVCDRFPHYKQNQRWCFDKYQEMISTLEEIKVSGHQQAFLDANIIANKRWAQKQAKLKSRRFPTEWLVEADKSVLNELKSHSKIVENNVADGEQSSTSAEKEAK